jgi:hypothetical protein
MLGYEELTEPERGVWKNIEAGALVELPIGSPATDDPITGEAWGEDRQVRAQLLYELLTGINGPRDDRPRALKLAGARITGALDLEAATLVCPLILRSCSFEQLINLQEAHASVVRLPGCRAPALHGKQLQTLGNLELNENFAADGEVNLVEGHIGGTFDCSGATLANADGPALSADGLTVEQSMSCRDGFYTKREIRLLGAHIKGPLSFDGARLTNRNGVALKARFRGYPGFYCLSGRLSRQRQ